MAQVVVDATYEIPQVKVASAGRRAVGMLDTSMSDIFDNPHLRGAFEDMIADANISQAPPIPTSMMHMPGQGSGRGGLQALGQDMRDVFSNRRQLNAARNHTGPMGDYMNPGGGPISQAELIQIERELADRVSRGQKGWAGVGAAGVGAAGAGYGMTDADTWQNDLRNMSNDYLGTDFATESKLRNLYNQARG